MPGIACPKCQLELELELQENGYCHCSCGEIVLVPRLVQPNQGPEALATKAILVEEDLVHTCQCGKTLRISGKAKGKKLRCPCGKSFIAGSVSNSEQPSRSPSKSASLGALPSASARPIVASTPKTTTTPPQRQPAARPADPPLLASSGFNDLLSDIPPVTMESYTANAQANSYASSSSSQSTNPYAVANDHLANAAREARDEKRRARERSSEGSVMNNSVLGGIAMMVGAIVWFVAGLGLGIIFFYPPILFFFGLMSLVRGLVSSND